MAQFTGTYSSYDNVGDREDLTDVIYDISPTATPFMSNGGRGSASNVYHEWQQDALAAADTDNAAIEGDDIDAVDTPTPTVRLGNYTQISRKTVLITGTLEAINRAGRRSEKAYQLTKLSKELKRDMESIMLSNQAAVAGDDVTPRRLGSILAFLKTNTFHAGDGDDPTYTSTPNDTRTDGTQRAFTEDHVKDAMQAAWDEGGEPDILMVGSFNKRTASGFAGISETRVSTSKGNASQTVIIGAADVYISDFGDLYITPNRFMRGRDALFLDSSLYEVDFLRPIKRIPLAKTGDGEKTMLLGEYTLKVKNEKGLAGVFDLTTS